MTNEDKRVVIVGGGVIGLCTAYYALKSGLEVVILDRGDEKAANCSFGNAGMIVPSHFIPLAAPGMIAKGLRMLLNPESAFYIKPRVDLELARWAWLFYRHSTTAHVDASSELLRDLNVESRRLFTELQQEGDFGLEQRGLLMLCNTSKGLDEEAKVAQAANRLGLKAEVLDSKQTAALDPDITMNIVGSVYFPDDCHLDPARFMKSLRQRVVAMGGKFIDGAEVTTIEKRDGKVVAVSGPNGRWAGGDFVLAGGSWTPQLLRRNGIKLSLQAGKGYSLTLPNPPQLPKLCSIFVEGKVAITPMDGALRFAGTMEVGGLDKNINRARVRGIIKSVKPYFPAFSESDFEQIEPWSGLRPVSPDGLPYLGKAPGTSNLTVASGHAMMGLSLGPVTGKVVADLLKKQSPFRPIQQMAVDRF